jgi:hypothetical protein
MPMDFRVYYDGGETYSGDAYAAPGLGVLCIVERDELHGRRLITQGDYYVLRERWYAVDFIGLVDYLLQPGPRKVLVGRLVERNVYYDAIRRAEDDPEFPPRTAWVAGEERVA